MEEHTDDTAAAKVATAAVADESDSPGMTVGRTDRVTCDGHNSRLVDVQQVNWGSSEYLGCKLVT